MNTSPIVERLIEIERAIGVRDPIAVRRMVIEAEECALELHKELVQHLSHLHKPTRIAA